MIFSSIQQKKKKKSKTILPCMHHIIVRLKMKDISSERNRISRDFFFYPAATRFSFSLTLSSSLMGIIAATECVCVINASRSSRLGDPLKAFPRFSSHFFVFFCVCVLRFFDEPHPFFHFQQQQKKK